MIGIDFDDGLREVGQWGKYQRQFYLLVSFPILFKGYQVLLMVFTVFVPKHRCAIPGLINDTYEIQSEAHRQMALQAVPSTLHADGHVTFDSCHVYSRFNITATRYNSLQPWANGTMDDGHTTTWPWTDLSWTEERDSDGNDAMQMCHRWVYDQTEFVSTLITEFDLVCERKDLRAHSNMMMMAGFLAGSTIASVLCDWLGRKLIYFLCLLMMMIFGIASAFPSSPEMLLAFRFLSGTGLMGVMVSGFVLVVEIIGGSMRTVMGATWQIVWLIGPFILAAISIPIRHWQILQLAGSAPPVIFLIYWWVVPESPRWLVSKGRVTEAMVTLNKVAKVNGKSCDPTLAARLKKGHSLKHDESSISPIVIFQHITLFVRFLIIIFSWAVISMTYYGLSLNVSNLSGGIRINFLASCVVELMGYVAPAVLLDRLGRKCVHVTGMLSSGLACVLTIFTVMYLPDHLQGVTTALAMIGKLGVSSSFAVIYLYSAELYPTVLRNFGVGCGSMFARIGSMLSPYIADLAIHVEGDMGTAVPLMVFGALALGAGLSSLLLPETLHRKLPETIEDAINFGKGDPKDADVEIVVEESKLDEDTLVADNNNDDDDDNGGDDGDSEKKPSLKDTTINGPGVFTEPKPEDSLLNSVPV